MPARSVAASGPFCFPGVTVPPRPTLEPDDLVTPAAAGRLLGIPASTVRTWIERYEIERLGFLGRWPAYDFNAIAAVQAKRRQNAHSEAA
jgi:hypothetical protein